MRRDWYVIGSYGNIITIISAEGKPNIDYMSWMPDFDKIIVTDKEPPLHILEQYQYWNERP